MLDLVVDIRDCQILAATKENGNRNQGHQRSMSLAAGPIDPCPPPTEASNLQIDAAAGAAGGAA